MANTERYHPKSVRKVIAEIAGASLLATGAVIGLGRLYQDSFQKYGLSACDPVRGVNALNTSARGVNSVQALYDAGIRHIEVRVPFEEAVGPADRYVSNVRRAINDPELDINVKTPLEFPDIGKSGKLVTENPCTYEIIYDPRGVTSR